MSTNRISWLRLNKSGQGYNIYRSDSSMDVANLPVVYATVGIDTGEYIDINVNFGEKWYYIVSSIDAEGNETFSEEQEVLCKENIYGLRGSSVAKIAYDGVVQWVNSATGIDPKAIDVTLDGRVIAMYNNSYFLTSNTGTTLINESIGTGYGLGAMIVSLSDGKVLYVHTQDGSNATSTQTSRSKTILYSDPDRGTTLHFDDNQFRHRNNYPMAFNEDQNLVFFGSASLVARHMNGTGTVWSNTSQNDYRVGACDSLGFITTGSTTGVLSKFFVDLQIAEYEPTDGPMWQDDTTFAGETFADIYNDRYGNVIVASQAGKVVKYDTGGNIVFTVNISKGINDFRVEYDGDIIVASSDGHLLRLSGVNGATIMETVLDEPIIKIAIDPGVAHIQRGSIIEW